HDLTLQLQDKHGKTFHLPLQPDPAKGGFVVDTTKVDASALNPETTATVVGMWGFDHYRGSQFELRSSHSQAWRVESNDALSLVIGRDDKLHIDGQDLTSLSGVPARDESGKTPQLTWTASTPHAMPL